MYRVGIVGCGGIAQVHAAVVDQLKETELAACADIVPRRAEAMASRYGCRAYRSMEEMLEKERLDAVHLCTPHSLHAPMAALAAEMCVAVFTEKPPAVSRDQWEKLKEAGRKVRLGVCFQNRYNLNFREAERLIAEGEYGAVLGARAFVTWSREGAYYTQSGWRGAWATEGGSALINQAIHTLDLMVRLLGKPGPAQCHMSNRHLQGVIETEDTVEAFLTLGGRPGLFYASNAYAANAPVLLEVQTEQAALRLEGSALEVRRGDDVSRRTFRAPEPLGKGYWGNGHLPCIRDFYRCLRTGEPFMNDLSGVEDTMLLVLDLYEQGKKGLNG